ncbi:MAG TPA: glycerol kinase GlpK [Tepidisphaeraceae bacterium]|nr:glycerol kinase GlpK [Tepidisphaeraceae bacterium]
MSRDARHVLAIDQSTSATKALVFDAQGRLIDRFSLEHRPIYPKPGRVEHDAEEIWRNTVSVIRSALDTHRGGGGEGSGGGGGVACLSIANQRETFVLFDRATGRPLHNAVVWQCRRGDGVCGEISRAARSADVVERKTGLRVDSYFSAPKLTALLREEPGLRAKLRSGDALFGTIDAYLLYRLTGGQTFATDSTNASRTLLFNIETLDWDAELCELFDVPLRALPEVRDSSALFGRCAAREFGANLPIAGVMGDSQAALFAHRCFQPGQAKVTIGTGSSILLNAGSRLPARGVRTIAWTRAGVPTYCLEGIVSYSAATITWLRDGLGLIRSDDEVEPAARAVADNGGVYLVPAFTGLSAPHWAPAARAAIVGLSAASTRDHVIRAAVESIAYQLKDALDSIRSDAGADLAVTRIDADGGAARNTFLVQFIADLLGLDVTVSDFTDFSPLGAAMAGMLATGIHGGVEDLARLPAEGRTVSPTLSRPAAGALHAGWSNAVRQVLAGMPSR